MSTPSASRWQGIPAAVRKRPIWLHSSRAWRRPRRRATSRRGKNCGPAPGPQDGEQVFANFLKDGLDFPDFLIAFAPKPIHMATAIKDYFPIDGARATYAEAKRIFEILGAGDRMGYFEFDDTHGWSQPRRKRPTDGSRSRCRAAKMRGRNSSSRWTPRRICSRRKQDRWRRPSATLRPCSPSMRRWPKTSTRSERARTGKISRGFCERGSVLPRGASLPRPTKWA